MITLFYRQGFFELLALLFLEKLQANDYWSFFTEFASETSFLLILFYFLRQMHKGEPFFFFFFLMKFMLLDYSEEAFLNNKHLSQMLPIFSGASFLILGFLQHSNWGYLHTHILFIVIFSSLLIQYKK